MDNELKPVVSAFQHSSSDSIQTQPSETTSTPAMENMSLKRRLETNDTRTLPAVSLEGNKNRVSIYKMDCFRFINAVKARPAIWQVDNIHYKNILRARKLWEEIQKEFPGISVEELKKRWKYLKDSYRKEMKRCQNAESNKCSTWRYYEPLHFLKPQLNRNPNEIKDKGTETSSRSPTTPASSESENDDEDEERDIPYNSKVSDQKDDVKTELLKIERRKMQILEEEIVKSSQNNNSDNYHFLMSLLPEMDKLGPVQKMRLRTKISQAVLDEVSLSVYENETTLEDFEIKSSCTLEDQIAAQTFEQEIKEEISNMYD